MKLVRYFHDLTGRHSNPYFIYNLDILYTHDKKFDKILKIFDEKSTHLIKEYQIEDEIVSFYLTDDS